MKLFTSYFDEKEIEGLLNKYSHVDFTLFINTLPSSPTDFSSINILALCEPGEYFGWTSKVIENHKSFDVIFTFDDRILNNCDNAQFLTLAHSWLQPDQYTITKEKKFEIAHLAGALKKAPGHLLRHEILERENEFKLPTKFFHTYGERYDIEKARIGREEVYSTSQYNVAIENFHKRGWFTEKLIDCFLLKTIPLYWGCSNIGDFFNKEGIIEFGDVDDLIYITSQLDEKYYQSKLKYIEENHQEALNWLSYQKALTDNIISIFEYNNIK